MWMSISVKDGSNEAKQYNLDVPYVNILLGSRVYLNIERTASHVAFFLTMKYKGDDYKAVDCMLNGMRHSLGWDYEVLVPHKGMKAVFHLSECMVEVEMTRKPGWHAAMPLTAKPVTKRKPRAKAGAKAGAKANAKASAKATGKKRKPSKKTKAVSKKRVIDTEEDGLVAIESKDDGDATETAEITEGAENAEGAGAAETTEIAEVPDADETNGTEIADDTSGVTDAVADVTEEMNGDSGEAIVKDEETTEVAESAEATEESSVKTEDVTTGASDFISEEQSTEGQTNGGNDTTEDQSISGTIDDPVDAVE
jgi:hypothetical protein